MLVGNEERASELGVAWYVHRSRELELIIREYILLHQHRRQTQHRDYSTSSLHN